MVGLKKWVVLSGVALLPHMMQCAKQIQVVDPDAKLLLTAEHGLMDQGTHMLQIQISPWIDTKETRTKLRKSTVPVTEPIGMLLVLFNDPFKVGIIARVDVEEKYRSLRYGFYLFNLAIDLMKKRLFATAYWVAKPDYAKNDTHEQKVAKLNKLVGLYGRFGGKVVEDNSTGVEPHKKMQGKIEDLPENMGISINKSIIDQISSILGPLPSESRSRL